MRGVYDIEIRGAAEPRRVRAELVRDGEVRARSPWIVLAAGETRAAQITLDDEPGTYTVTQVTDTGSNVHEDLVKVDLGKIEHLGKAEPGA